MAIISGLNNRFTPGFTTTASSNFATLTLTNTSTQLQVITGSGIGYTVKLPVESTMPNGFCFTVCNTSSSAVSITSSGSGSIISLGAGLQATVFLCNNTVTTAAAWNIISNNPPTLTTSGSMSNPFVQFGGANVGQAYNAASGTWVTIAGSKTFFNISIAFSNIGTSTGAMTLTNLSTLPNMPVQSQFQVGVINSITYTGTLVAIASGSGTIILQSQISSATSGANNTQLTNTNFNNTSQFQIHGWF